MEELEKENKELRTIKESCAKLKDTVAKLEMENLQLRVRDGKLLLRGMIDAKSESLE